MANGRPAYIMTPTYDGHDDHTRAFVAWLTDECQRAGWTCAPYAPTQGPTVRHAPTFPVSGFPSAASAPTALATAPAFPLSGYRVYACKRGGWLASNNVPGDIRWLFNDRPDALADGTSGANRWKAKVTTFTGDKWVAVEPMPAIGWRGLTPAPVATPAPAPARRRR